MRRFTFHHTLSIALGLTLLGLSSLEFVVGCGPTAPDVAEAVVSVSLTAPLHTPHLSEISYLSSASAFPVLNSAAREGTVSKPKILAEIVETGSRCLAISNRLTTDKQMTDSDPATFHDFTPENPRFFVEADILQRFQLNSKAVPTELNAIMALSIPEIEKLTSQQFVKIPTKTAKEFLTQCKAIYSEASRFISNLPIKAAMGAATRDIRPWLKLRAEQQHLFSDLINQIAFDSPAAIHARELAFDACSLGVTTEHVCDLEIQQLIENQSIEGLVNWVHTVLLRGEKKYQSLFQISVKNPIIAAAINADNTTLLTIPFADVSETLTNSVSRSIATYWNKLETLTVNPLFYDTFKQSAVINFTSIPGALTKTSAIGGNQITLDKNADHSLKINQATLAHEIGHTMGFVDCYVEFWDSTLPGFVYYNLDQTNLMCSLSGHIQEIHKRALTQTYPAKPISFW